MRLRSLFAPSSRTPALPNSPQRRQFYRLPLDAPTLLRDARRVGSEWEVARIANLSGGGLLLAASGPLASETPIRVRVPAGPHGASLDVKAVVIESAPQDASSAEAYWIRARFLGAPYLREADREAIVAYIHARQRLLLRERRKLPGV